MDVLRTPDDRFEGLADFDFEPQYLDVGDGLRMHYLDEGPRDAPPILCLHGEPTWCYLYRHFIPGFVAAGHRVLAPDLIGFGRSDKPAAREDYTYQAHVDWMLDWMRAVDVRGATLFAQDWGGLIGLRLVAEEPARFARLVLANTALPTGDQPMNAAFRAWRSYSQEAEPFNTGRIVFGGTVSKLTEAEVAAYNAPFPDAIYQAGAREFPLLVPDRPDDPASAANRAAWEVLCGLDLPVLTLFGAEDRVMLGVEQSFIDAMQGATGQPHKIIDGAGHFIQEDAAETLVAETLAFMGRTS